MIKVFISYAREDLEVAEELFKLLKRNGYQPWMDKKNLLPGMDWQQEIERSVRESDVQLFLLSPRSVGKRGVFQREIRFALKKAEDLLESDISIVPYLIENCEVPSALGKYQWLEHGDRERDSKLLSTLYLAANQRGLLNSASEHPVVSEISATKEVSLDGCLESEITVPKVTIPSRPQLGEMVSAILYGKASELLLDFKNELKDNKIRGFRSPPFEFFYSSSIHCLNKEILSTNNLVYRDSGGVHGNGYTNSLNLFLSDGHSFSGTDLLAQAQFVFEAITVEAEKHDTEPLVTGEGLNAAVQNAISNNTVVNECGVEVRFNQYEVFCYAHGPFSAFCPWDRFPSQGNQLTSFGDLVREKLKA